MIAHVNGIDLFYEKTGSGRPLVMMHGNGEDHTIFDAAVNVLSSRFTCYCLDTRGHGQSGKVDEFHYADMARDAVCFIDALGLEDAVFYGFSDGGIVGLLAAAECKKITALIVSGANITPNGVKPALKLLFRAMYLFKKDPKIALMLREPNIGGDTLKKITCKTLVLTGSKDMIREKETRRIAAAIPGAKLNILPGEGHGTYIIHQEKIARIILDFVG